MPSINANKLDTECIVPSGTEDDGKKVLRSKENIWNDETIIQKKNIAKVTLLEVIMADLHCIVTWASTRWTSPTCCPQST